MVNLHFTKEVSCQPGFLLLQRSFVSKITLMCLLQLKEVVLKSGKVLRADVCVVGVGKGCVVAEPGREGREEVGGDVAAGGPWDWVARGTGIDLPALLDCHT